MSLYEPSGKLRAYSPGFISPEWLAPTQTAGPGQIDRHGSLTHARTHARTKHASMHEPAGARTNTDARTGNTLDRRWPGGRGAPGPRRGGRSWPRPGGGARRRPGFAAGFFSVDFTRSCGNASIARRSILASTWRRRGSWVRRRTGRLSAALRCEAAPDSARPLSLFPSPPFPILSSLPPTAPPSLLPTSLLFPI